MLGACGFIDSVEQLRKVKIICKTAMESKQKFKMHTVSMTPQHGACSVKEPIREYVFETV
jgi:hypothetical protein